MTTSIQKVPSQKSNWLDNIENVGNKIPDITMLFFCVLHSLWFYRGSLLITFTL